LADLADATQVRLAGEAAYLLHTLVSGQAQHIFFFGFSGSASGSAATSDFLPKGHQDI